MKIRLLLLIFPLLSFSQSYQVQDSKSKEPIPFVNIWIKDAASGTTSNENGKFELAIKLTDILILSAIGYERLEVPFRSFEAAILMNRSVEQLDAVVIDKSKNTIQNSYGVLRSRKYKSYFGCSSIPWMLGARIPYKSVYDKNPFVSGFKIPTSSNIKNAKFAIRLYEATDILYQFPLNDKPIYAYAPKGRKITYVDLKEESLKFPKNGLVIVLEFLIISENLYEYKYTTAEGKKNQKAISYEPAFAYRTENKLGSSTVKYFNGAWSVMDATYFNAAEKEFALELIMNN